MYPGNYESAGKRQKGTTHKGSPWLRAMLVEAAWGASHTKATYLAAQYHRLAAKRGRKRAIVAVGHSILVIAYHVLARQQLYAELAPAYFDARPSGHRTPPGPTSGAARAQGHRRASLSRRLTHIYFQSRLWGGIHPFS